MEANRGQDFQAPIIGILMDWDTYGLKIFDGMFVGIETPPIILVSHPLLECELESHGTLKDNIGLGECVVVEAIATEGVSDGVLTVPHGEEIPHWLELQGRLKWGEFHGL